MRQDRALVRHQRRCLAAARRRRSAAEEALPASRVDAEARATETATILETLEKRIIAAVAERQILADVVESTEVFIGVLDLDYTILAIDKANVDEFERVYGVRPHVGDNMLGLLDDQPEHREQIRTFWSRALAGEEFSFEAEFGSADRAVYSIKFNTLRDAGGTRIGAFNIVTDITQQHRDRARVAEADERVRQAQKIEAIGQLTATSPTTSTTC